MPAVGSELDALCVNTIRMLAVDAVEKAGCGHPGMPMGFAAPAYVLWTRFLKHNPADPNWPDRDRVVLSAGHGSMLLYGMLHLTGYDLSLDDLKDFRQWQSRTPGHPEYRHTPGVETTTGPLGQGLANGVGMAMAERFLAARFNTDAHAVVDHYTYVIAGDGDLMEGVASEAASLAGHLKLGKLIVLYDDNHISIDGTTDMAFTEDRAARFAAYGWHVVTVADGNDLGAVEAAITEAKSQADRPSIVCLRTQIGFGSPERQNTSKAHGEKLGADETLATKKNLGWPTEPTFLVPDEVAASMAAVEAGKAAQAEWDAAFAAYSDAEPEKAAAFSDWMAGRLPDGWDADVPVFEPDAKGTATRGVSGKVLNAVAGKVGNLFGGSADLAGSNKTMIAGAEPFLAGQYGGRNLYFGVREHAMGAIANGMAYHGGIRPYVGTFFIFSDYYRPAIRLAAMNTLPVISVLTHDSIGVGEDGPTHQPIEQLASLRAIPGLTVLRPGDANEVAEAWKIAVQSAGPVILVLTRQSIPILDRTVYAPAEGTARGAYVVKRESGETPDVLLIGTGSELAVAISAAEDLEARGVSARVVSMPSWELFEAQDAAYRDEVLPPAVTARISVEAGSTFGWAKYVGTAGRPIGIDRFGASAPSPVLFKEFGVTAERVSDAALELIGKK